MQDAEVSAKTTAMPDFVRFHQGGLFNALCSPATVLHRLGCSSIHRVFRISYLPYIEAEAAAGSDVSVGEQVRLLLSPNPPKI